jgi:hypothetical protein
MKVDGELRKLERRVASLRPMRELIENAETRQLVLIARECTAEDPPELREFGFALLKLECEERHEQGDALAGKLLSLLTVITDPECDAKTRRAGIEVLFGRA